MQKKVRRKLVSLFSGELGAAVLFAFMWIMYIQVIEWAEPYLTSFSTVYAFSLLEFILLQGSLYWFLTLKQFDRGQNTHLSHRLLRFFVFFKRLNILLIFLGLPFLIYQLIVFPVEIYWFVFLYAFAVLEYINYYHIRLSYQSIDDFKELIRQKGLRSSRLARELQKR